MLSQEGQSSGKTSPAGDLVTQLEYDAIGNLTRTTDPKGRATQYAYDSMHRLESMLDPGGNRQELSYDAGSNVIRSVSKELDADGAEHEVPTTFRRDALGRMIERKNELGHTWSYSLGADGLARRMTDPQGYSTTYQLDRLSRLTRLTRPEGISETYTWDKAHRMTNYADALGQSTSYVYDAAHRQTKTTYADGGQVTLEYDGAGQVTKRTDPLGTEITQVWDGAGRRISSTAVPGSGVTLAGPMSESYTYDGLGRLTEAVSGSVSTQLAYDSVSRLVSESTNGRSVQYELDATGRPTSITDSSGHVVTRTFDALDRLSSVAETSTILGSYGYRGAGSSVHTKSLWNGLEAKTSFDALRRPTSEKVTTAGQLSPVYHEDLAWSPRNLKVGSTRHDLGQGHVFTYDGAGRLKTLSQVPEVAEALGQATKTSIAPDETFAYNAAQAMVSRTKAVEGVAEPIATPPDTSGRNRPASGGTTALTWNLNGNLVRRGNREFVHDWRNRIREVRDADTGATLAEYEYDAFNRRIGKTVGSDTVETVYQGWQEAEQYKNGQLAERRIFGQGLEEMVRVEKDLDGNGSLEQTQVPVYDSSGNLALISDGTGRPLERYTYTSFGRQTILGSQVSPVVEQVRVEGDEIWIEMNVQVSENLIQQAVAAERIFLEETADASRIAITAHHPLKTGANARRRLIVTTTDPPAAGTEVRLVLPKDDLQDEFWNTIDTDIDLTFLWQPQVVLDTAPPRITTVVVRDGRLEIAWSETPDQATAPAQITLDGQPLTWTLDDTSYRLVSDGDIGLGEMTLDIGTGPSDLSGQGLAEAFQETFTVPSGQDQVVYLGRNPRELENSAVANAYGFQGRPVDPETGLMYFRNRYYDPQAGIFVTADPLGYIDGPSMYAFARFDPINSGDPLGLYDEASAEQRRRDAQRRRCAGKSGDEYEKCLKGFDLVSWIDGLIGKAGDFFIEKNADPVAVACYMAQNEFPDSTDQAVIEAGISACGGKAAKELGGLAAKGVQKLVKKKADDAAEVVEHTPTGVRSGEDSFSNQVPDRLSDELADAASVGARPMRMGDAGIEEVVNQGTIKFVVTESGDLLVTPHSVKGVEISHAVLSGGQPVLAAGQADIAAAGGKFLGIDISPHSGHFKPTAESLRKAREAFAKYGIEFPEVNP